jgi:hypothetical protein
MNRRNLLEMAAAAPLALLAPPEPTGPYEVVDSHKVYGQSYTVTELLSRETYQERLASVGIDIDVGGAWHYEAGGISMHVEHWPREWAWSRAKQALVRLS